MAVRTLAGSNRILASLPPQDLATLLPQFSVAALSAGDVLEDSTKTAKHLAFVCSGLVSLITGRGEEHIEVGMVGREGVAGWTLLFDGERSGQRSYVRVAGQALMFPIAQWDQMLLAVPKLLFAVRNYIRDLIEQMGETTLATGKCTIAARLARWILMSCDRLETAVVPMTQEGLSDCLGVWRPGVTAGLQALESQGLIARQRGQVTVVDAAGLARAAGCGYQPPAWLRP